MNSTFKSLSKLIKKETMSMRSENKAITLTRKALARCVLMNRPGQIKRSFLGAASASINVSPNRTIVFRREASPGRRTSQRSPCRSARSSFIGQSTDLLKQPS